MVDLVAIRSKSWSICRKAGLPVNDSLPLLELPLQLRTPRELAERALAVEAIAAASFGFSKVAALEWLAQHDLQSRLTDEEGAFLKDAAGDELELQWQFACLHAFAWMLGKKQSPVLAVTAPPSQEMVRDFPDLRTSESPEYFYATVSRRTLDEVIAALDVHYCAHWACVDSALHRRPMKLNLPEIRNRRWALEWALRNDPWEDVALDT